MNLRVLLVYPNIWDDVFPLSVLTLSALLKREGIEVRVFSATERRRVNATGRRGDGLDPSVFPRFRATTERFAPDLVAFSVVEDAFPLATRLLEAITDLPIPTLVGGVFATFAPLRVLAEPGVDMVCVGEGEHALLELCRRLERGDPIQGTPNLWVKDSDGRIVRGPPAPLMDLDELPPPDYDLLAEHRFPGPVPLMPHRGCPYACTFCNSPAQRDHHRALGQRFFRKQSMERLRGDLEHLVNGSRALVPPGGLYFCSDTLLAWNSREFDAFVELYSDYRLPFSCHTTPETLDPARVRRLVDAGLLVMNVGLQHGNERFRREVLKRGMGNRALLRAFAGAADAGAQISADSIVGFPGETHALAMDTIRLNRELRATHKQCSVFVPYHGTALRAEAVRQGWLAADTLAVWKPERSQLDMPAFPARDIGALARDFQRLISDDSEPRAPGRDSPAELRAAT
ncbi:MAG: B12-binding domain-containing radical SAM protein [Gammaproteobacteria bacterium]